MTEKQLNESIIKDKIQGIENFNSNFDIFSLPKNLFSSLFIKSFLLVFKAKKYA